VNPAADLIEPILFLLLGLVLLLGIALLFALRRRADPTVGQAVATLTGQVQALAGTQNDARAATESRLAEATKALTDSLAQQAQAQSSALAQQQAAMSAALATLNERLGKSLSDGAQKTQERLGELQKRLALIDAAQTNLANLSSQVGDLQKVLSGQKARGAFGEAQLEALVRDALPAELYEFQATVGAGRVDCLLKMPNPPGSIPVDSKFPLEGFRAWRAAAPGQEEDARRRFGADVRKHFRDIATKYIVPGETADSALMFVPSEAVYAALHTDFNDLVEEAWKTRVWLVSPTTMMAILNTLVAVMRDVQIRKEAAQVQKLVGLLVEDVERLGKRVGALRTHFDQAAKDIDLIEKSTESIQGRGARIREVKLDDEPAPAPAPGLLAPKA
jgi:DNA recombination protein RmuC